MYKHFTRDEFKCQYTGENEIHHEFIMLLDSLRELCGFPLIVNSGYRSPNHPIEKKKDKPGMHSKGKAADLHCLDGWRRMVLVKNATKLGFTGIGIYPTWVHLDTRNDVPVMWVGK